MSGGKFYTARDASAVANVYVNIDELEKSELEETRKAVGRLIIELRNKYPLNVLTDEGVLPNYAFPEPGVKLESVVSQEKENGKREYEAREYIRPASSAIRELAAPTKPEVPELVTPAVPDLRVYDALLAEATQ